VPGARALRPAGVHVSPDAWAAQAAQPLTDGRQHPEQDVWMFGIGLSLLTGNHD